MPQRDVAGVMVCHESSPRSGPQRPVLLHLIAYRSGRQPTMRSASYPFYPVGAALAPASRLIYHPDTPMGVQLGVLPAILAKAVARFPRET
ncbi:hypothetical protein CSC43_3332 [Pseudomonas aeruginosa]|nr:hypothetical protein CSC43_3332 [Pseudomonas aeruginosa]